MVAIIVNVGARALVVTKLRVQRDCSVIIELAHKTMESIRNEKGSY